MPKPGQNELSSDFSRRQKIAQLQLEFSKFNTHSLKKIQRSTSMKRLISVLKKIRLNQVLAMVLAGVLMLSTAACSGGAQARESSGGQGRDSNSPAQGIPGHRQQNYQGGMNGYSDTDARYNKGVQAKSSAQAKGLVDNAERNVIDQTDDVGTNTKRILDKKGENLDQLGDNLKRDTKSFDKKADRVTSNVKGQADNIRDDAKSAGKGLSKVTDQDLVGNAKQAVDKTSSYVQDKAGEVARNTQRAIDKAS